MDWFFLIFIGICLFAVFGLPISIYVIAIRVLSARSRRKLINVLGVAGALLGLGIALEPWLNPPTHSGDLGKLIFIPLGALLCTTCLVIIWFNNRSKPTPKHR